MAPGTTIQSVRMELVDVVTGDSAEVSTEANAQVNKLQGLLQQQAQAQQLR
jgi:hypothetical protein